MKPDGLDVVGQWYAAIAGIDDEPSRGPQIVTRDMKSAFHFRRHAALDLNGPLLAVRQFQKQVDLGTR